MLVTCNPRQIFLYDSGRLVDAFEADCNTIETFGYSCTTVQLVDDDIFIALSDGVESVILKRRGVFSREFLRLRCPFIKTLAYEPNPEIIAFSTDSSVYTYFRGSIYEISWPGVMAVAILQRNYVAAVSGSSVRVFDVAGNKSREICLNGVFLGFDRRAQQILTDCEAVSLDFGYFDQPAVGFAVRSVIDSKSDIPAEIYALTHRLPRCVQLSTVLGSMCGNYFFKLNIDLECAVIFRIDGCNLRVKNVIWLTNEFNGGTLHLVSPNLIASEDRDGECVFSHNPAYPQIVREQVVTKSACFYDCETMARNSTGRRVPASKERQLDESLAFERFQERIPACVPRTLLSSANDNGIHQTREKSVKLRKVDQTTEREIRAAILEEVQYNAAKREGRE